MFQEQTAYLTVLLALIIVSKRFIPSFQGNVGHAAAKAYVRLLTAAHNRGYQIQT